MNQAGKVRRTAFERMLDAVERAGNRVPHPAVLFLLLIALVVVLSHVLYVAGIDVSYERINLTTHKTEQVTTPVKSLLAPDGIRFMFTSVVPNFVNFGPVGIILVAMIGIGLAERSGLIRALVRKIVAVAPASTLTAIVITLGVLSSIASDAGYLVLIPLGAAAFHSLGRHPLAGLAAAFAGVAAVFGANFLVKPIDGILAEMTNDAIHIVDPSKSIDLTANFYFGIASSLLLIIVCTVISNRIVEPRLGKYAGDAPNDDASRLSPLESRGLTFALVAFVGIAALVALLTLPAGAPLRSPASGAIIGNSPFMDSLVCLIMLTFLSLGIAYGIGAKTIRNTGDAIDAITKTLADLGGLLLLFFIISQFVAYFNFSNIGTVLAVKLADALKDANLSSVTLLAAFLAIGFVMSIPVPNILPKWAILAPVFVPLFLKLGIAPDVVLAAYRVSDSPPNVINPLLPHFALVVGFAQRWQKDAGVGTVVAMMLPYAIATGVAWTLLFFTWYLLGIPFGPKQPNLGLAAENLQIMSASTTSQDIDALLEFMFRLGQAFLASGEQTAKVELILRRAASAYGIRGSRVVAFPTALFISIHDGVEERVTLAEGPGQTLRLDQIADVYTLGDAAQRGDMPPREGLSRLSEIMRKRPRFGVVGSVAGHCILSVGVAMVLTSTLENLVAAGVLGTLVGIVKTFNRDRAVLAVPLPVVVAAMVSALTYLAIKYGLPVDPLHALVPPLVTFLPGAMLTLGMVELAYGDMVSGSSRLVTGFVQLVLLVFGLAAGAVLAGYRPENLADVANAAAAAAWPAWLPWAGVVVFGTGVFLHFSAPRNSWLWMITVLLTAFAAQQFSAGFFGRVASGFFGMLVATPLGYLIQLRFKGPPAIVTFLPSFWLLVPGALGLISVKQMLSDRDAGLDGMITTVFVFASIALGTLMGASLYKWLTERFGWWQLQMGRAGSYLRRNRKR